MVFGFRILLKSKIEKIEAEKNGRRKEFWGDC